jgi:long-chain fatty acid transport protein
MRIPFVRTRVAAALAGAAVALSAGSALATGFQLNEQSASGLGNAFAAGAAFTDDVTAMWWNPAALSALNKRQAAAVIHLITPKIEFNNNASQPALSQPLGGDGGDAGGLNVVPNMFVAVPINPQWAFGLGINVPFGLTTEYDDDWIGRFQAIKSQIKTINVNPAISWKPMPNFAVGVGVNYMWLDATLTQAANYSAALLQAAQLGGLAPATIAAVGAATPGLASKATITADDGAWGWNIGAAWDATPQLRLAASYRSKLKFDAKGEIDFNNPTIAFAPGTPPALQAVITGLSAAVENPPTGRLFNRGVQSDIELPDIANLSVLFRIDRHWEVMADAQWTGWSSIPELRFNTTPDLTPPAIPLEWDDSWKLAIGTSYRYNEQWKARFGIAFDQTPVTSHPTPRLPDSDRWWIAIGGEYTMSPNLKFDAGLVYIKGDEADFNQNLGSTPTFGLINGRYDASVIIFSLQGVYSF